MFINTPNFLFFSTENQIKAEEIEDELDLTNYKISEIGPQKYKIFACIIYHNTQSKYSLYIKEENEWKNYRNINQPEGIGTKLKDNPCLIVYKGISDKKDQE